EAIAEANRVMAAMVPPRPRWRLAARRPLPWHPPAPDLARLSGIGQVEDHHDVADVAVHLRRDVGVATVEGEAMHAGAATLPESDLARPARLGYVKDAEPLEGTG